MADILGVGGPGAPSSRSVSRTDAVARSSSANSSASKPASPPSADRVEISSDARQAQQLAALANEAKNSPDIRDEIVEEARVQISSGELLRDEVTRQIAAKIVDALL